LIGFTGLFTPGEHRARDDGAAARCDRDGGERAGEHQDWREPPGASSSELGTRQPFWVKV
jgi:hypothetical protein